MNSYLLIAERVLVETRQPMSAGQILRAAYQLRIVPPDLFGKTQHKTLHARLSEDISAKRSRSVFVRSAPGRFFLRRLLTDKQIPARHRREYHAPIRAEQLRRFYVLAVSRRFVEKLCDEYGRVFPMAALEAGNPTYQRFADIHDDTETVIFRVLVILLRNGRVLSRRRLSSDDEMRETSSLALVGYVKRQDRTLFAKDDFGTEDAAARTISEQLSVEMAAIEELQRINLPGEMMCALAPDGEGAGAVAAICSYCVPESPEWDQVFSDVNGFDWREAPLNLNDLESFDIWSRVILSHRVLHKMSTSLAPHRIENLC